MTTRKRFNFLPLSRNFVPSGRKRPGWGGEVLTKWFGEHHGINVRDRWFRYRSTRQVFKRPTTKTRDFQSRDTLLLLAWHTWMKAALQPLNLTCKRGSVGKSEGLPFPRLSFQCRLNPKNSNSHGFELHRPSIKGTKLLLKVIKVIIIITNQSNPHPLPRNTQCRGFCWSKKIDFWPKIRNSHQFFPKVGKLSGDTNTHTDWNTRDDDDCFCYFQQ